MSVEDVIRIMEHGVLVWILGSSRGMSWGFWGSARLERQREEESVPR